MKSEDNELENNRNGDDDDDVKDIDVEIVFVDRRWRNRPTD
jgi:hypothetical protein